MASGKYIGNGCTLKVSTTTTVSATAGTALGAVLSIQGPDSDAPDIDMGTLDTTGYVPSRKGKPTTGDMTITVAYDPADAGWVKVKALAEKATVGGIAVSYASTALSAETCSVYFKGCGRAIERDAMMTRTITVHPSSSINWN